MPDLDIVVMAQCQSNINWEIQVPSKNYVVRFEQVNPEARGVLYDYTCTCKDYQMRRAPVERSYCKHIQQMKPEHCGWNELIHGGKAIPNEDGWSCPQCGSDVDHYRAGV